jgi:NodT family efflux transporter outer membrane factor (OMF) lipoprotein
MMRRIPILAALLLASACTVGPDYARPARNVAPDWVEQGTPGQVDTRWWRQFGDPQLTALIERALKDSPDLAEATARLAEARANRDAAAGGRLPSVNATGSATENRLSENGQLPVGQIPGFQRDFSLFDLGFDASWEIDLWGRRTRQVEAAEARAAAALAGRQDAMVALIAEIARNYADLRLAQADITSLTAIADADAETARLTGLRFTAGEASRLERETAEGAARASAAAVPEARARAAAATYRIATLVGATPEEVAPELRTAKRLPDSPDTILTGLRSELLERRPDVRRAEHELAAATADVGVATADLFPRFSLLGSVGQQARSADDLASGGSTRFQIGPSFSWPIFSGGTIRAQIRAADARADAAAARYEKAVIGALADSETAINRFLNARAAAFDSNAALVREQEAYALAQVREGRGEDDRLALMRAKKSLIAAEKRASDAASAKLQAATSLFKALGGGWA